MTRRLETTYGKLSTEMVSLLLVAYEFPPLNSAGVLRSLKFATYLPEFGIQPTVVTITQSDSFSSASYDKELELQLPNSVQVERVQCPAPHKRLGRIGDWIQIMTTVADPHASWWKPHLDRELPRLVETHRPEAIYVSIPPFSMANLWRRYAKQLRIPLIVDFRDAWSQWQSTLFPTALHYLATKRAERRSLEAASVVICSSKQIRDDLSRVHPHVSPSKFSVITNGHESEFQDGYDLSTTSNQTEPYIIGYVGAFYYSPKARNDIMSPWWKRKPHRYLQFVSRKEDWLYRSPYFFFKAVRQMLDKEPWIKDRLRIRFAGRKPEWLQDQVDEFKLEDIVEFHGFLKRTEVREFEARCNALLVTSAKVVGGSDYSIAGKTFEYVEARKPIVGFVTEGAQKNLLEKMGVALICDPDETEASANMLTALITGHIRLNPDVAFLNSLHRRQLTNRLAERIRSCVQNAV